MCETELRSSSDNHVGGYRVGAWIYGLFVALFLLVPCEVGQSQPVDQEQAAAWQKDLDYLTEILPRVHANAFHTIAQDELTRNAARVRELIPKLSEAEIIVEMARLMASIGDGHTRLEFGPGSSGVPDGRGEGFRPFPVRFYHFADGLYVRSAASRFRHVVGGRVLRVGDTPVGEALDRAASVAHHDNPMTTRYVAPLMLIRPAVLYSLGVSSRLDSARLTVEMPDGDTLAVTLTPADSTDDADAIDVRGSGERPLYERRPGENYWLSRLDGGQTLYFRYRQVRNEEDELVAEFAERLAREIERDEVERLVVDLRGNSGGDGSLNRPLLHAVLRHPKILQRGRMYVLTDRLTFSAAMRFAVDLETHTPAIFVGEPTGSRPNQYGEIEQFRLPSSGLLVSYASQYFQSAGPADDRQWIGPDLAITPSFEDYRRNHDPVLDAVRRDPQTIVPLRQRLQERIDEEGVEEALAWYRKWRSAPSRRYRDTEATLTDVAIRLWIAGRPEDAEPILELVAEEYPQSVEAQENLGEIYAENGRLPEALDATLRSLRLDPGNGDAIGEMLELCRKADSLPEAILLLDFASDHAGKVVRSLCWP